MGVTDTVVALSADRASMRAFQVRSRLRWASLGLQDPRADNGDARGDGLVGSCG